VRQRLPLRRELDHKRVEFAKHSAVDQRLLRQFLNRLVPRATLGGAGLNRARDKLPHFLTIQRHEPAGVVAEELGQQ
jgi:hypothetical protein